METKKREYNKKDPIVRRATFRVDYPQDDLVIKKEHKYDDFQGITEEGDEKRFIRSKRLTFNLDNESLKKIIFEKSGFHNEHGVKQAKVSSISFKDCDFKSTFFGGTRFYRVHFTRCTFEKCDFMDSEFVECTFDNCKFDKCTAFRTIFTSTIIDPKLFFINVPIPDYNFSSVSPDEQKLVKRDWIDLKLSLARQLLKSSSQVFHTEYIDTATYLLKKSEIPKKWDSILNPAEYLKEISGTAPNLKKKIFFIIRQISSLIISFIILLTTKGGTSISRLFLSGAIIILVLSFHMIKLSLVYGDAVLSCSTTGISNCFAQFVANIPYSMSLILGFGYSGFSFPTNEAFIVVLYAIMGIAWYALLVQIIVRKIYK